MSVSTSTAVLFSLLMPLAITLPVPQEGGAGEPGDPGQTEHNVIEFLLDDIGIDFLELYDAENQWPAGYAYPATPNIDAIAAHGLTFRNAWAYPVCSADRAAALTGRQPLISAGHPYGTGLGGTVDLESHNVLTSAMMALPLAHAAESTPYLHLQVGKWHLGNGQDDPMSPVLDGGVSEYRGCLTNPAQHGGLGPGSGYDGGYTDYTQTAATNAGASQLAHQTTSMHSQEVADALAMLPTDGTPFVLRQWFHYGHAPWKTVVPDSELAPGATMRGNAQFPFAGATGLTYSPSSNPQDPDYPDPNTYQLVHRRMKAMVEAADKAIGDVLAGLTEDQRANTIVIIRSDNGTERLALTPTPSPTHSLPTSPLEPPPIYDPSHAKLTIYEQGIRVPLIVGAHPAIQAPAWIAEARRGTKVDALASTVDVWATIAEATLPNWESYQTDGVSLMPVLLGAADTVRSHIFSYNFGFRFSPGESCWDFADPAREAVRNKAGYKLIRRLNGGDELFHLGTDPLELNNLLPPTTPQAMAAYVQLQYELDKRLEPEGPRAFCFGDGSEGDCPCANNNDGKLSCGRAGCANSAFSSGALLFSLGQPSVSADSLELRCTGVTPNHPGFIFQGKLALTSGQALGNGLRCVGGDVIRLENLVMNGQGYAYSSSGLAALGGVTAGQTKTYQLWYRDVAFGTCTAEFALSNLSNAIEVSWLP